jgi:hypothetical protein
MTLVAAGILAAAPGVAWAPQPGSQTLFVTSPIYETLYEGTRGPGKTNALLMDYCQHVGTGLGRAWRGILFRQNYPALADVVEKSQEWIPTAFPGAVFTQSGPNGYTWSFPDGETLLFRYIDKPKDYRNYHGHEYPWMGFDELTNWPDAKCYNIMQSCCRSSFPNVPRKLRATTNPHGPGHHWVKARFIDPAPRGTVITDARGNRRVTLHGHWSENRFLMANDPDYITRILASTEDNPDQQSAWVDGNWDVAAGAFFGAAWSARHHVLQPFAIPRGWRVDRAFDWGSSKPFSVGWWAETDGQPVRLANGEQRTFPRGSLVRVGEWYGCQPGKPNVGLQLDAADIAKGILERQKNRWPDRQVHPGPADSSIFDVQDGHSIGKSFESAGVTWTPANKGPGSRKNGWQLMRDRLGAGKPKAGPDGKPLPLERPGLFVFADCLDFIRTVPMLPRDDTKPDDIDTDAEDHIADESRYRVLAPPAPAVGFLSVSI